MKTLLINPPMSLAEQAGKSSMKVVANILPPLGIGYIAAVLEENDKDTEIIDCQPLDMRHKELKNVVGKKQPDIVGIAATTLSFPSALKVAKDIREVSPSTKIVIGGPHITATPDSTMAFDCFDYGIYGEGEITMLELVNAMANANNVKDIKGLYFRDNGDLKFTGIRPFIEDLDSLPFPARHLFPPLSQYHPTPASCRTEPLGTIITSRGCPNKCTFCDRKVFGNVCRMRSVDNVLAEMEDVIYTHKAKEIKFFDDTFTLKEDRIFDLCEGIRERGFGVEWSCLTRVNAVSKELLFAMKRAGCWQVAYGVESGDQKMLNRMKKGITLSQIRRAVNWAREAGLNIRTYFVVGTPGETIESMKTTLDFAKSLDVDEVNFYAFVPLPGTEIYEMVKDELRHRDYEQYNVMVNTPEAKMAYIPEGLTEEELKRMISYMHKSFYFRSKYIMRQILRTRKKGDLKRYITGVRAVIGLTA